MYGNKKEKVGELKGEGDSGNYTWVKK